MSLDRAAPLANQFEQDLVAEMPRVRAFLRRMAPADADDLLQESVSRALQYRGSHRDDSAVGSWMMKIAFRVFLDHREQLRRRPRVLGDDVDDVVDPRAPSGSRVGIDVEPMLQRLDEREREVLVRFHRSGHTIAEISASLGLPVGTVKSHLHRARRKLGRSEGGKNEERT